MSETSPPKPTTTSSLNFRRRLTSVKRASDPYDAVSHSKQECLTSHISSGCHTQVVCRNDHTILELRCKHGGTGDDGALGVLVLAGGLEVRGVVCAVYVVSGLLRVSNGPVWPHRRCIHGPKLAEGGS
jgi:hypothetical protein